MEFERLESLVSLGVISWRMTLTLCLVLYSVDVWELRKARLQGDNFIVPQYQSQNAFGELGIVVYFYRMFLSLSLLFFFLHR